MTLSDAQVRELLQELAEEAAPAQLLPRLRTTVAASRAAAGCWCRWRRWPRPSSPASWSPS